MNIQRRLAGILETARCDGPYALVDYPNYLNPGDSAIWLGARILLEAINGRPPAYASTLDGFSAGRCRAAIGRGTVYWLGGGNFGDFYPRHFHARLRLLAAIPDHPVVQLPASCAFAETIDADLVAAARRVFARRAPIRFFAREERSRDQLRDLFGIDSDLCPDMAHALDIAAAPAGRNVVALLRRDREGMTAAASPDGDAAAVDWPNSVAMRRWSRFGRVALMAAPGRFSHRLQDGIARGKVAAAAAMVAPGRVAITDRLHGLVIAHGLGRPAVALDNRTGKVHGYLRAWREHLPNVHAAFSMDEALALAARLAACGGGSPRAEREEPGDGGARRGEGT